MRTPAKLSKLGSGYGRFTSRLLLKWQKKTGGEDRSRAPDFPGEDAEQLVFLIWSGGRSSGSLCHWGWLLSSPRELCLHLCLVSHFLAPIRSFSLLVQILHPEGSDFLDYSIGFWDFPGQILANTCMRHCHELSAFAGLQLDSALRFFPWILQVSSPREVTCPLLHFVKNYKIIL